MSAVVIVGAGQGGLQAAISLRQAGHAGPVILIGDEPGLPYQRPPLSKAYLLAGDESALALRPQAFLEAQGIEHRPGLRVDAIDRDRRRLSAGGGTIAYDHLILATGARNLNPPLPGIERCVALRTLDDARRLRAVVLGQAPSGAPRPRRLAVIGGGFVGLEFAAVARKLGHAVTVAEAGPRLMGRALSAPMAEAFADLHRAMGTDLRLADAAVAVTAEGVILASGAAVAADVVLLAAGVRPNDRLAAAAGLTCDNGVAVDGQLLTSDPAISALGDCASFPDPRTGLRVRLESVQAATDHARHIAARLTGGAPAPYAALPWFWSDQGDHKLQIAGLAMPDEAAERAAPGVVLRLDAAGGIVAVETDNAPRIHMKARRMLAAGPIPAEGRAELLG